MGNDPHMVSNVMGVHLEDTAGKTEIRDQGVNPRETSLLLFSGNYEINKIPCTNLREANLRYFERNKVPRDNFGLQNFLHEKPEGNN